MDKKPRINGKDIEKAQAKSKEYREKKKIEKEKMKKVPKIVNTDPNKDDFIIVW